MKQHNLPTKDKLWTRSFISACIGNFLLFFAFYLLVPIFPLYLIETFHTSKSMVGVILSSYTIAALLIRPFSAFLLDMVNRKPVYVVAFLLFVLSFVGYPLAGMLTVFLFVRILHGFTFGFVTTAGNSLVVDIMPASRRGEGLGYFGVANNLAMAIGPMISLFMHESYSFNSIFYTAIISGIVGFGFALAIKSGRKVERTEKQPIAFDRFFLFKGFNAGVCLMLMGIPYGMVVTYVALYGKELGIKSGIGVFFSLMAIGLIGSRLFAGKNGRPWKIDKSCCIRNPDLRNHIFCFSSNQKYKCTTREHYFGCVLPDFIIVGCWIRNAFPCIQHAFCESGSKQQKSYSQFNLYDNLGHWRWNRVSCRWNFSR